MRSSSRNSYIRVSSKYQVHKSSGICLDRSVEVRLLVGQLLHELLVKSWVLSNTLPDGFEVWVLGQGCQVFGAISTFSALFSIFVFIAIFTLVSQVGFSVQKFFWNSLKKKFISQV